MMVKIFIFQVPDCQVISVTVLYSKALNVELKVGALHNLGIIFASKREHSVLFMSTYGPKSRLWFDFLKDFCFSFQLALSLRLSFFIFGLENIENQKKSNHKLHFSQYLLNCALYIGLAQEFLTVYGKSSYKVLTKMSNVAFSKGQNSSLL